MRNLIELKRKVTADMISRNPTDITIHRTSKGINPATGGKATEPDVLGPFTVRIVPPRNAESWSKTDVGATGIRYTKWMLFADHTIDITYDENTTDEFAALGKYFRVVNVIPFTEQGQITSVQAELEVI